MIPEGFWAVCNYFCNEQGIRGTRLGRSFESSKHVKTRIAIHPETWINSFWIIESHKNQQKTITRPMNTQKTRQNESTSNRTQLKQI